MTNFKLHGQPYYVGRKLINPYISINASKPYAFYTKYYYGTVNVSKKPLPLAKHIAHDKSSADEYLTRARRTVLFSDSTGLAPVKFNRAKYGNLNDRSFKAIHCDHVSFWVSPLGTMFILNEPYLDDPNYLLKLSAEGLAGVVVPTDLSPYCGNWNSKIGEKPLTTTYLICDLADTSELTQLFSNLDLEHIPAWNCVKGINHV